MPIAIAAARWLCSCAGAKLNATLADFQDIDQTLADFQDIDQEAQYTSKDNTTSHGPVHGAPGIRTHIKNGVQHQLDVHLFLM